MNITDIRIKKVAEEGKLLAIASVTFDGEFVVHDIKVLKGQNGNFIAMPSKKVGESEYKDVAHPISQECRTQLRDAIVKAYEEAE